MTIRRDDYYVAVCDFPGCGEEADYGDYTALATPQQALDGAIDSDWMTDLDGQKIYCLKHPRVWEIDLSDGNEEPAKSYLLVTQIGNVRVVPKEKP